MDRTNALWHVAYWCLISISPQFSPLFGEFTLDFAVFVFCFFLFRFFSFTILKSLRSKVSFSSSTSTFTIYLFIQFCVFAWMRVRHCFGDPSFMSIANSFANCALRGIGFLGIIIGHWLLFLHRYLLRWIICFLFLFFFFTSTLLGSLTLWVVSWTYTNGLLL